MSMVVTRSPLTTIGMNGAGAGAAPKRRSARLSTEGQEENEPPSKKARVNAAQNSEAAPADAPVKRRTRKVYENSVDDFTFSKSKRVKPAKEPAVRNSRVDRPSPAAEPVASSSATAPKKAPEPVKAPEPAREPAEDTAPKTALKKTRRKFPTTPERDAATKTVRRSKRISNEHHTSSSPSRPAHAKSHAKHDRLPSPVFRPVTIEKKRKKQAGGGDEEEKTMRIALPFADTPIIKRNKEMRKASADSNRRSSSGMRGRRASSLIDEGRGNGESIFESSGNARASTGETGGDEMYEAPELLTKDLVAALPHTEVPTAEFYKHIGEDLTEPRRMRCLLGWCGSRALPAKPEAPKNNTKEANDEFQALQAARVIQEELSLDLVSKGTLSDWFSRDEEVQPPVPLHKKPNPRNVANAAKAEELERELERLKKERQEWEALMKSAIPATLHASPKKTSSPLRSAPSDNGALSPLQPTLLSSPDRAIFAQLHESATSSSAHEALQQRLQHISSNLEFSIDQFAESVHAIATTRDTAEQVADRSLKDAAEVLDDRAKDRREGNGGGVGTMEALRGLARVLNGRR